MEVGRLTPTAVLIAAIQGERVRKSDGDRIAPPATPVQSSRSPEILRRQLVEAVRGLAPDDPQAMKSARQRLIRMVLLWEFGPSFREHPDWRPMLQRIEIRMDAADPQGSALADVVRQLQRETR